MKDDINWRGDVNRTLSKSGWLKSKLKGIHQQQGGQILLLASILLALSGIMVIPLAHYINSGIKTTQVYQRNAKEIYAADRGIQYGLWKIKYDSAVLTDRTNGVYATYPMYSAPAIVPTDHNAVSVQVSANWLFYYLFRIPMGSTPHNVNLTTTCTWNAGTFTINFTNSQQPGGPPVQPIVIQDMGVWLPPGFKYEGSPHGMTTTPPTSSTVYMGTNLTWNGIKYNLGKYESAAEYFSYSPTNATPRGAASWVQPQQESVGASWDNAVWWYDVNSTAVDNSVSPNKTTSVHAVVIYDPSTTSVLNMVSYILSP